MPPALRRDEVTRATRSIDRVCALAPQWHLSQKDVDNVLDKEADTTIAGLQRARQYVAKYGDRSRGRGVPTCRSPTRRSSKPKAPTWRCRPCHMTARVIAHQGSSSGATTARSRPGRTPTAPLDRPTEAVPPRWSVAWLPSWRRTACRLSEQNHFGRPSLDSILLHRVAHPAASNLHFNLLRHGAE